MRIWHLTRTLSGGAGLYALRLSNALRADGVESRVLVAEGPIFDGADLLRRVDSPVRRFAARGFRSLSHRISLEPFQSLHGAEFYEAPDPVQAGDIVHLHGMAGWIGVSGLRRLIPKGAIIFWTAHDIWMLSGGCQVYRGCDQFRNRCSECPILRFPWKRLAEHELRLKQTFIQAYQIRPGANSRWMADRIRDSRLFGQVDSIPIIPPIIDDAYFAEDIPNLRRALEISADRKVICLGSRSLADKFKGISEFLEHLSQKGELASRLTVLLFGPGKVQIPANLDVRPLGSIIDPCQLAKVYRTSDVFVSPTKMESFGMTLTEAQAVGTPVAAFDVGGVRDAVHPDTRAKLESLNKPEELMSLIAAIITQDAPVRHAGSPLRAWARTHFSAKQLAREQAAVYTKAVGAQ